MKNPFKRDTASALTSAQEDVAAVEGKISGLQQERHARLLDSELTVIEKLDQQLADQHRALKVHHDRVTALRQQQRRERYAELERERAEAIAALKKSFKTTHGKAVALENAVTQLGDALFDFLETRESAFASWPDHLPRLDYQFLHRSNVMKELGWALFSAGRPTAMTPCRIPNPNNIGLGVAGIEPKGIAGEVETEHDSIIGLLEGAPIEQPEEEAA
jgi:hypothetical protein